MSKKLLTVFSIITILLFVLVACAPKGVSGPVKIILWTKEGEADGGYQYVKSLTDAFTAANPNITFDVINKNVEVLREDFQTASLAGAAPELIWTVSDHAGPFTTADLIQPVDNLFDMNKFVSSAVDAVRLNGKVWGVPISNGNHLMLIYNKDMVPTAPKDTDEFIAMAKSLTDSAAGKFGFVYNQTEPFWLVPWLGGYGGKVFAADGVTPMLNTPEMVNTLNFLHDIKFVDGILPAESNYDDADALFKEGKAAMIINGDWSIGGYKEILGDKLGVAPIPMVKSTGKYPAPFTSGVFFMIPKDLKGDKLEAVKMFIGFVTNDANQIDMVSKLSRLPALKTALGSDVIKNDPLLSGSAEQMTYGSPMPVVLEMRCNWDSLKPEMQAVLADQESAEDAAAKAQSAAEKCVADLE